MKLSILTIPVSVFLRLCKKRAKTLVSWCFNGLVNLNILPALKNGAELALGLEEEKGSACRPEYNQHIQQV